MAERAIELLARDFEALEGISMNTVDLLEQAIKAATDARIRVRQEWLGGATGGLCRIGETPWLFVDLSLPAGGQLDQVLQALRACPLHGISMGKELQRLIAS